MQTRGSWDVTDELIESNRYVLLWCQQTVLSKAVFFMQR
jgi:hypothetical protein